MELIHPNILNIMDPGDRKQFGKLGLTPAERAKKSDDQAEIKMHCQYIGFLHRLGFKDRYIHANPRKKVRDLPPGWPDFTVFGPNAKVLVLDFKTPNGVISEYQERVWSLLALFGHVVHVPTSYEEATKITHQHFGTYDYK